MGSRVVRTLVLGTTVALVAVMAAPAHAAFPGQNGKIAFSTADSPSGGVTAIRTVNPDGTGGQDIAPATGPFGSCYDEPHSAVDWAPHGRSVAFNYFYGIRIATANDTTERDIEMFVAKDFAWSPDGQRIAFVRWATQPCNDPNQTDSEADEVWIVNADGTGLTQVTTTGNCAFSDACTEINTLSWSPDGERLAYTRFDWYLDYEQESGCFYCQTPQEVWFADPDVPGSDTRMPGTLAAGVDWSPDGQRLLLSGSLRTMNPDGTGVTSLDASGYRAVWSPDGTKIAYQTRPRGYEGTSSSPSHIYTREANGGNPQLVSAYSNREQGVDWQPIPVNGYPRPKGASPIHLSLVPAYQPCTAPNRTHGPPLSFGSCNPPTTGSGALNVGTADWNGLPARSVSHVRFDTLTGNPATVTDEADVQVTASITDVHVRAAGEPDYAGELEVNAGLRITDKLNTPHPGGPGAGTVSDTSLDFPVPCTPTPDTTDGSDCALATSVDALIPGAVTEGRRAIWALGQVEVRDSGGAPFLRQGIFIP